MALGRIALAALGVLAYKNRDKLGDLLSGGGRSSDPNRPHEGGGMLDQVLGGSGVGELLDKFRNGGKGRAVDSWVGHGPNEPIDRGSVEQAIDPETMDSLMQQTGMSREELLDRLATNLPDAVNDMTPEGRLPQEPASSGTDKPTLLDSVKPRMG